jgi:hypothetical protein
MLGTIILQVNVNLVMHVARWKDDFQVGWSLQHLNASKMENIHMSNQTS